MILGDVGVRQVRIYALDYVGFIEMPYSGKYIKRSSAYWGHAVCTEIRRRGEVFQETSGCNDLGAKPQEGGEICAQYVHLERNPVDPSKEMVSSI